MHYGSELLLDMGQMKFCAAVLHLFWHVYLSFLSIFAKARLVESSSQYLFWNCLCEPLHMNSLSWWPCVFWKGRYRLFICWWEQFIKMRAIISHLLILFIAFQCKYPDWYHKLGQVQGKLREPLLLFAGQVGKEQPRPRDPEKCSCSAHDNIGRLSELGVMEVYNFKLKVLLLYIAQPSWSQKPTRTPTRHHSDFGYERVC